MRSRKAAIEVQFNWLFVLIIGAVILMIFTAIIFKQKKASENSQNALMLRQIESIMSGLSTTTGTTSTLPIANTKIEFACNRYSIGSVSKQVDVMHIFTPSTIKSTKLLSMTLDWSVPFRITNIVYLTSPTYRYAFVGSGQLYSSLSAMMPNETFSEQFRTLSDIKYRGEDRIRLIVFDNSINDETEIPQNFVKLDDEIVSALKINGNEEFGDVVFFEKKGNRFKRTGNAAYVKKETLLGAVISDDPAIFSCVMSNLFSKLRIVGQIYLDKTSTLSQYYTASRDNCAVLANNAYSLNSIEKIARATYSQQSISSLLSAENELRGQNRQAQIHSCATIY